MNNNANWDIARAAEQYATVCHDSTNHQYNGFTYKHHLMMVVAVANKFIHLIPENDRQTVLAGCWVHDVIEDTRQTYNDVKSALTERVAELAYALTNEKGKTRKHRANDKYYLGIASTPYATFIKVCDRIANMQYSAETNLNMFDKYVKENENFVKQLYHKGYYDELFAHLQEICDRKPQGV